MAQTVVDALSAKHEVTVICGRPSYEPTERRSWRLWQTESAGAVKIIRVGSTDYSRSQMKRRVLNYLTYVALSVPRALLERCDVVLGMTDPPFEGIVAAIGGDAEGKKVFVQHPRFVSGHGGGRRDCESGGDARVWERLHRWALRRADARDRAGRGYARADCG